MKFRQRAEEDMPVGTVMPDRTHTDNVTEPVSNAVLQFCTQHNRDIVHSTIIP